ncbi:Ldh family oxidoreductase [Shimia sagamensis]|uniref:Malate/lactate/ureidoglycolate dehydrogenase, LDH2 family n=1 Tax=Shimia sagamensis TaxID=1566352 RepID=A0ABY1P8V9_9RHOB|nr:Ldh family oxidoreductase [Shimia sagamensis]SMP28375.1 Malate/lactate/ureidoglycolate dehydrogenase, LDH2 family [Shimia sagamensis]
MAEMAQITLEDLRQLAVQTLSDVGYGDRHAAAIAEMLLQCQRDDCQSHGLFRLLMCHQTMKAGKIDGHALPHIDPSEGAIVRVNARDAMSILAVNEAMPTLIEKARKFGMAAMTVNNCFHFSALWPEVERLSEEGLAGLSMVPSHSWVAPAGGKRGTLGTNPLAFSWPRMGKNPFTFDFATSGFARGEIELYLRAGKPLPEGVAVDDEGNPTIDPQAALDGAMLTFGGYKGSALSIMIELMAGPLIDDLTSAQSMAFAEGQGGAPYHGQIILALDPYHLSGGRVADNNARAERLFADILDQGARLPSQRRFEARARNTERGYVEVPKALLEDLKKLGG